MIQWDQFILTAGSTVGGIFFYLWKQKRGAKREQDKRHEENQKKLDDLLEERDEERKYGFRHRHVDIAKTGPLLIENLRNGED